ncbi:MAG: hypothetical protein ACRDRO_21720 [Pseudonocardiaceae bacterium]
MAADETTRNEKPRVSRKPRARAAGARGATSATSPEAIERRRRDLQCVQLRAAGANWQAIADQLGYSGPGHAYQRFQAVMVDYPREDVDTARNLISDRFDVILLAVWPKVRSGDHWAIDRATRVLEDLAKLHGANRPEKLEVSSGATELDEALRELEKELRLRAGGQPIPQE